MMTVRPDGSHRPATLARTLDAMPELQVTAPSAMALQLRAVPSLFVGGTRQLLQPKTAGLLAYLALCGETARRTLATLLWPKVSDAVAAANLRQCLFRLHKQAGGEMAVGKVTLRLAGHVEHDAASAHGDASRGELLQGLDFADCPEFLDWLTAVRGRERQSRSDAIVGDSERLEAAGDLDAALALALTHLAAAPLEEHAHRRVIRLHYLRGDNAAAMAAFDHCEAVLRAELDAAPSAQTLSLGETLKSASRPTPSIAARAIPPAVLRPPIVVGRAPMLLALRDAWAERRAFLVVGDAGMGKSRLLEEFAMQASHAEALIVVSRARPGDDHVPYASMLRVLAAVRAKVADPHTVLDGQRIADTAVTQLAAAPPANLHGVVVDDLHFADAASLELLTSLACSEQPGRPCWGFSMRASEGSPALRAMCDKLLDAQVVDRVPLAPLGVAEMSELLDSLAIDATRAEGIAASLVQHTGGNPMYALETIKLALLTGSLAPDRLPKPASVGALIERRLQQLSESALKLARVAAIAGPDFDVALAEHVLDMRALALADAWRELEAAQILRGSQFAHDLVYEAALASIPAAIAAHVHATVAGWLEARPHEPARVARHWLAAGREAAALKSLHAAATAARAAMRRKEEAALLEQAARIEEDLGDTRAAFHTLAELADTCLALERSHYDRGLPARLIALAEDDAMRGEGLRISASIDAEFGDFDLARDAARDALAIAERIGDAKLAAESNQVLAVALSMLGDSEGATRAMLAAEPWMVAHAEPPGRIAFHGELAVTLDNADRHAEAQRFHRLALEGAKASREYDSLMVVHSNLSVSLSCSGRLDAAIDNALTAERLRAMNRDTTPKPSTTPGMLMRLLRDAGRYGEAMRWAELARSEFETQFAVWLPLQLAQEAWLWVHLGQHRRADAALQRAREAASATGWIDAVIQYRQGQLERALGRDPRALFEAALAAFDVEGRRITRAAIRLDLASSLPPAEGRELALSVLEESEARGQGGLALSARVRVVQCLLDGGEIDAAAEHARRALALEPGIATDDVYRGELWWQAQRALDAAGLRDEARAPRRTATQWIERIVAEELPPSMRHAFVEANPVNRALLRLARG
jgi:DNA-binding SARP family transcriptional activator/tetratricopeptide (TPR) repeat protein